MRVAGRRDQHVDRAELRDEHADRRARARRASVTSAGSLATRVAVAGRRDRGRPPRRRAARGRGRRATPRAPCSSACAGDREPDAARPTRHQDVGTGERGHVWITGGSCHVAGLRRTPDRIRPRPADVGPTSARRGLRYRRSMRRIITLGLLAALLVAAAALVTRHPRPARRPPTRSPGARPRDRCTVGWQRRAGLRHRARSPGRRCSSSTALAAASPRAAPTRLGSLLFRDVKPGDGYRVRVGSTTSEPAVRVDEPERDAAASPSTRHQTADRRLPVPHDPRRHAALGQRAAARPDRRRPVPDRASSTRATTRRTPTATRPRRVSRRRSGTRPSA